MTEVIMRLTLFTVLPVLLGAAIVIFDRTAVGPVRRAEAFLIPLLLVGVGGGGVSAFITHCFIAGSAARSSGWEPGSPFRLQVGFAHLAIGLLGAVAAERRDGFREATVVAATVFGVGAAVVPLMASAATGILMMPGSVLQHVPNLIVPALLIWFLLAVRRAERTEPPNIVLRGWMIPVRRGSVATVAIAAPAFAVAVGSGQVVEWSLAGIAVAAVVCWWIVSRAPSHRASGAG